MSADTTPIIFRLDGQFFTAIIQNAEDLRDDFAEVRWGKAQAILGSEHIEKRGPHQTFEQALTCLDALEADFEESVTYVEYDREFFEFDSEAEDVRELPVTVTYTLNETA